MKPTRQINFEVFTKNSDSLLENSAVTSTPGKTHMVIFFNSILMYVDLKTSKIIFKKDFTEPDLDMEYFLSPTNTHTNKLNSLTPIVNRNCLVALNNSNDMLLISYDLKNMLKVIKSSISSQEMKFESFHVSETSLLGYNRIQSKLYCFSIDQILKTNSFSKCEFEIGVNNLTSFGFSRDLKHVFTIENQKLLQFYKRGDLCKKVAEIPLYIEALCVTCLNDFLVIAMKDRRIISYFIFDSDKINESREKLSQLESRLIYCPNIFINNTDTVNSCH